MRFTQIPTAKNGSARARGATRKPVNFLRVRPARVIREGNEGLREGLNFGEGLRQSSAEVLCMTHRDKTSTA